MHPSLWKSAAEARRPSFQRLAVQIVFRSNSRHGIGLKGFAGLRKVLYRTLVVETNSQVLQPTRGRFVSLPDYAETKYYRCRTNPTQKRQTKGFEAVQDSVAIPSHETFGSKDQSCPSPLLLCEPQLPT